MKFLNWVKENINLISFITGTAFIVAGKTEVGQIILRQGGTI